MSLANDNKKWQGSQSDTYTYDRGMKPIAQPPCDLPSQHQFENITDYIEVTRDRWNNEIPVDQTNHRNATAEMGDWGNRQFASNAQDVQSTGYGKNEGLNVIEYGQGAAFQTAERVAVDVSRADRGQDS